MAVGEPDTVPASGPLSGQLLENGAQKTYKDFPRGMPTTQIVNADLLAFPSA
ncbi:hypothetical protein [Nocardia sp. NPDC050412]|uniref:hypothetical protein n=1 Tax=Nocardia sp. NPDC050412 TaxID=3364320 RepID=UPI0037A746ED